MLSGGHWIDDIIQSHRTEGLGNHQQAALHPTPSLPVQLLLMFRREQAPCDLSQSCVNACMMSPHSNSKFCSISYSSEYVGF